jgi:membrane peptidoglycan carboxypeptidase
VSAKRRADGPAVTRKPKPPSGRSPSQASRGPQGPQGPGRSKSGGNGGGKGGASGTTAGSGGGQAKRRMLKVLKWGLIAALVGSLLVIGVFVYLYKTTAIPDPNKDFQTQTSFVYYGDGKTQIGSFATQNRVSIPYSDMSQHLRDAVVAAEDRSFWTNSGIDPKGIIRAAFNDARGGATQGASTITQQYVKILYLTQERSLSRKVHEAILSLKLQKQLSKQEILEGYLNTIYFGRGAYGVQAAAQAFFGVDAKELSLEQSAVLASVLNNPSQFDPANGKQNRHDLLARYRYVLSGMVSMHTLSQTRASRAEKHLPKFPVFHESNKYAGQKGHVLTLVRQQLHGLGFTDDQIDGGGLRIFTTLTPKAMAAARSGVMAVRPKITDRQLHVGVATVQPGTGALLGFFAGQNYLRSQINWAEAGGMVGSTIKPASLAAVIADGYSLKSTWDGNSPYRFPDGLEVHNEGDSTGTNYGSAISTITATEQSVNTAFVDMSASMKDGPDKILGQAEKMGIPPTKADPHYPGIPNTSRDLAADALITLGRARVSAINMANAYATIANGGQRADVHVISKVVGHDGKVLYQYKPHTTQAIKSDIDRDVSYALQQVVLHGTGANAQAVGRPAAGKTGTATNDNGDVSSSWFVGFTPQLVTAVMYVRGDGDNALNDWLPPYNGAAGYFGAGYPTATWAAVMKQDLAGLPVENFPPPAYVTGKPPEGGHSPYTPPPPPPTTHHTSAPPTSAPPTSSAPTSSAPPPPSTSTTTSSSSTSSTTSTPTASLPTGGGGGKPSASSRPVVMSSREPWW